MGYHSMSVSFFHLLQWGRGKWLTLGMPKGVLEEEKVENIWSNSNETETESFNNFSLHCYKVVVF